MNLTHIARWSLSIIVCAVAAFSVVAVYERMVIYHAYPIVVSDTIPVGEATPRELIAQDALACQWGESTLGLFSSNVFSPLIYYSHLFPTVMMCVLAFVMWRQARLNTMAQLFLAIAASFTIWCLLDLTTWALESPDYIMFFWASMIYFDPLIYVLSAYLFYLFAYEKDVSGATKTAVVVFLLPILVLAPTLLNLTGFNYTNCDREAMEGPLWLYVYAFEVLACVWMVVQALRAVTVAPSRARKIQIALLAVGLGFFMLAFSWGNLIGTFTEDWAIAQYGLFGMPIFLAVVMYLIIQYRAFEIRAIATSALVMSLVLVLASVLLLPTMDAARPVIVITLLLLSIMGYLLVRSVRKEIRLREQIQKQEEALEVANAQQLSLINFISHEVKGALGKAYGAFGGIIEGDYGPTSPELKSFAQMALVEMKRGVDMVMDILDSSNMKKGTLSFKHESLDVGALVKRTCDILKSDAQKKGLELVCEIGEGDFTILGDAEKLEKHVIRNLIDNSIKYTLKGSVHVSLTPLKDSVQFTVRDTGVGISDEDKVRLFTEGGRGKESTKVNVSSTGYGLFIAKQVVDAHKGKIHAESDGPGHGSTFVVDLPRT